MRSTYLLRTSVPSIAGTCPSTATLPGAGGFSCRSKEYLASAAVNSLPLWNRTPRRSVKSIVRLLTTFQPVASAGRSFSFASHSIRDSYMGALPQWFAVRIPPNGAMWAGSCSSAHVTLPPRGGVAFLRFGAAFAAPASEPAATAPAPIWPALTSRSRRLRSLPAGLSDGRLSDGLSDIVLPLLFLFLW